ncbi:MAG: GvpL/GvpF family gas vesicle protein [Candidatus Wallbacteria bacterium]|nr:GvpL/GvpF family gas vesicle protein [Candidatus Wallbacteria bacterium]
MEGLYVYCIREKSGEAAEISGSGIGGSEDVKIISHRDLEVAVSRVSLEQFGPEIRTKALENLAWIKEKAVAHEMIIEAAMNCNGKLLNLIPMKFGTIFKEEAGLKEALDQDYPLIKKVLEITRGKQEWSVKAYLKDRKKFEQLIRKNNETIREAEKNMADLPEGTAFFMEEELNQAVSEVLDQELTRIAESLYENLKKQIPQIVKINVLGKELTGRREPMVLNSACLIPEADVEIFKKDLRRLNREIQADGIYLESSGPWPAYNFTNY